MDSLWFLLSSQSLNNRKTPKERATEDKMSRQNQPRPVPEEMRAMVCLLVCTAEKVPTTFPSPTLFSNKVHSVVWGGSEKPGHPAGRPNPNQRGEPSLAPDYRCGLFTSTHPTLPRNVCPRVYAPTCTLSGSSGLLFVPFTNTTRTWMSKAVG